MGVASYVRHRLVQVQLAQALQAALQLRIDTAQVETPSQMGQVVGVMIEDLDQRGPDTRASAQRKTTTGRVVPAGLGIAFSSVRAPAKNRLP